MKRFLALIGIISCLTFAIPEGCTLSSEDFTTEDGILTLDTTKGQTITLQFS